ncbi:aminotransferase class V-fold PLP-dependent enzyme [Paracoccaceae bacterium GXU_MW_L88]
MTYDVQNIRSDFPILASKINGKPLVYLDNGASAQKPQAVLDAVAEGYGETYSNVHRGLHHLSNVSTSKYEAVRGKLARFLNAPEEAVLFNTGTTFAINLIAQSWGVDNLEPGDEILISVMEHHANIVPWHFLRERHGIIINWVAPEPDGSLPAEKVIDAITPNTKLIALTHMSNTLGTVVDVATICAEARARGIVTVIDGSQAAVHMPIDMAAIQPDFYAVTGHKLYGPSASGALYVNPERYGEMRPFMGGGDMIKDVSEDAITYAQPPHKFEAGTPPIVPIIGLGAAIDYMSAVGMENIAAHEAGLAQYASARLNDLDFLDIQGQAQGKGGIFSFTMKGGVHPHDISTVLDKKGVAVRAGHHCAQPLMKHLGVSATCRASFGMYNTREEVDALADALTTCYDLFA